MPSIRVQQRGWSGSEVVSHRRGKPRYESAVFLGHGGEIDLTTGPAMTLSPAAALAAPRTRAANWTFAPYDPPGPVKTWTIATHRALYLDATAPPPGEWTLIGSNPPEIGAVHGTAFRMSALSAHGKTVVVLIKTDAATFAKFLPVAERLLASLRFASS